MYWCATTLTTVGYGDLAPQSAYGQMTTIFFLAMPLTIVGGAFNNEWGKIEVAAQQVDSRRVQRKEEWAVPEGKVESLVDDLQKHLSRMKQQLEECERIAPDGAHWHDLEEKLKMVAKAFEHCKTLYPQMDDPVSEQEEEEEKQDGNERADEEGVRIGDPTEME